MSHRIHRHTHPRGRTLHVIDVENLVGGSRAGAGAVAPALAAYRSTVHVGADNALLDVLDPSYVATHYDRVIVGSGDHLFGGLLASLRARSVAVVLVVRDQVSLSRDLGRLAMHRTLSAAS